MFINTFLYTEEYIEINYERNGFNPIDLLSDEMGKITLGTVFIMIIWKAFEILMEIDSQYKELKENDKRENDTVIFFIKLCQTKFRTFFIFIIGLSMIYLYFIAIFFCIYSNLLKYVLFSTLVSIILNALITCAICFFAGLFKKIGIKLKSS